MNGIVAKLTFDAVDVFIASLSHDWRSWLSSKLRYWTLCDHRRLRLCTTPTVC